MKNHQSFDVGMVNFLKRYSGPIVILVALFIRVLDGIRVPLYMDEIPLLYNVSHFVSNKTILPEHFSYPTFFSYLMIFPVIILFFASYFISGYSLSGLMDFRWMRFLFNHKLALLVFGGRFVSMVFSMATIALVFYWAKKRYGLGAGLIAILIIGLDPFGGRYVAFSRYALPDVTAAFFVTAGILLCFEYLNRNQKQYLFVASLLIGLAVNTKYNAGMAVIPLVCTPFLAEGRIQWKTVFGSIGFFIMGLIVGSPGWLIIPHRYIQGYLFEINHVTVGHLGGYGTDWLWVFKGIWRLNTFVLPVVFLAVGYAIYKHTKEDIVFLFLMIPSFLYIGQIEKKSIHYFIFLFPILALYMGKTMDVLGRKIQNRFLKNGFIGICVLLFFINPLFKITEMVKRDLSLNNVIAAKKWIQGNIPNDASILIDPVIFQGLMGKKEMDQTLEELRASGSSHFEEVRSYFSHQPVYHIFSIRAYWHNPQYMPLDLVTYVVVSSGNYSRFFIQDSTRIPDLHSPLYHDYLNRKLFYEKLFDEEGRTLHLLKELKGIAGPKIRIYQVVSNQSYQS